MIKFKDKAFIAGTLFSKGMIAEFDARTEAELIADGDADYYLVQAGISVENATNATNATNALNAVTAETALLANHAQTADTATNALNATNADTAAHAVSSDTATSALFADAATQAGNATTAELATLATTAATASSADKASALMMGTDIVTPSLGRPMESIASYAAAISCSLSAVDERLELFVIPAGTMGTNSILQFEPLWTFTNSINNKTLKIRVGGETIYSATRTTSVKESPLIILANRNSLKSQISPYDSNYTTAGSGTPATYSIDFTKNVLVELIGNRASTADTLTLEYYRVLHTIG